MKKVISLMLSLMIILTMCICNSGISHAAIALKDASTFPENFQHGTLLPDKLLDKKTKIDNTNVFWEYKDGTLTIWGTGPMNDYEFDDVEKAYLYSSSKKQYRIPWQSYQYDIKKIVVKSGITRIGNYSFGFLKTLKKIDIADSVNEIGVGAFMNSNLGKIKIPNGVKKIGYSAFQGNVFLRKVDLNKTEIIDSSAFSKCVMLKSVVIPESVKEINSAFPFADTPVIKFKGGMPPEITQHIDAAGNKSMGCLTSLGGQTIYIPEGADRQDFLREITRTEYWDKKSWNFVEYDDEPLIKAANEISASLKISKLKRGFKVTVNSEEDVLKSMGKEGAACNATYKFYRSTKKSSGYKLMKETRSSVYKDTKVKKGKKYYYKATVTVSIVPGGIVFGDEEGEEIRVIKLPAKRA